VSAKHATINDGVICDLVRAAAPPCRRRRRRRRRCSRAHALAHAQGSTNGTLVNGQRLAAGRGHRLQAGDVVEIGASPARPRAPLARAPHARPQATAR
jgi:pSer/pThr/pTyr-binding forkhead associated (FHA) protein